MSTMILAPHMDDETLGCGGVIQLLDDVTVVFLTEREVDVRHTALGPVAYHGEDRLIEMEAVAAALGFKPVRLRYVVHELERAPLADVIGRLETMISEEEVDLLLVPGLSHDEDHAAVRRMVAALCRPQSYAGSVLEYMTWGVPGSYDDAVIVPLQTHQMDLKMKAIELYASQVAPAGRRDDLYPYSPNSAMCYAAATGRLIHRDYAEAFVPRRIVPSPSTGRLLRG